MIGLDGAAGGKGSHVVDDEHGQDRLDGSARDGGLVNADAEQQVRKSVDEDNSPRTGVHDALERVGDARGDDGAQIGAGKHGEQSRGNCEDREVEQHRDHDVKGVGDRGGHTLAQLYFKLLDAGNLDEERDGEQGDDNSREQTVGTGVGSRKGARDLGRGDLVGEQRARGGKRGGDLLRHHDNESGDGDDHAGKRVIEALVLSEAVADQSGQDNGRDVEGAQRNCRTPGLKIGKTRRIEREQREHDVVNKNRDTRKDIERRDGCEGIAQGTQVNLVSHLRRDLGKFVEEALSVFTGHDCS